LISLLAVDLLASRYDVNDLISFIWEERLQPGNSREIFHLLCSIARGYRSECQTLLSYFQHQIEETISASLNDTNMPRNRFVLIYILGRCQNEIYGGDLDSEHYYDEMVERELEYPYDPDFDSGRYYEHEDRLQIDDDYREMWRQNIERREKLNTSHRTLARARWEDLFQRAVTMVACGPGRDICLDLADQSPQRGTRLSKTCYSV
jgi:hypothetical protein